MKPIPLRQCYHCKQSFPASTEYFHKRGEGFHSYCKACNSDVRRSRNREISKELWWRRQQSSKKHRFEHRKKGDPRYSFELTNRIKDGGEYDVSGRFNTLFVGIGYKF